LKHPYRTVRITIAALLSAVMMTSCSQPSPAPVSSVVQQEATEPTAATETADTEPYQADGMLFSAKSGFYDNDIDLTISAPEGWKVYYTLDGSVPTAESDCLTEPIHITDRSSEPNRLSAYAEISQPAEYSDSWIPADKVDKATVVRAIAVSEDGDQTPVASATYFIGFGDKADYYKDLRIISLMTAEDGLFDSENGIYVSGRKFEEWKNSSEYDEDTPEWRIPGNYTQKGREWERPAAVQFFRNGEAELVQDVGIRIHGGATRSYPQKSFNIYARSDYGLPKMEYDLFGGSVESEYEGSAIEEFDTFMLRNGGNDAMYTRFRDKLAQSLVSERSFLTQGMEPCIVFINGEYWGHYEITEKTDDSYVSAHCGIPDKDVCIIKKEELDEGDEATFEEWQELREWIKTADFSDETEYEKLCNLVDMQDFIEYVSAEIYIDNENWGKSNSAMWKAQTVDEGNRFADGRWRFIMFDADYSSGSYGEARPNNDTFEMLLEEDCFISDLMNAAMKSPAFCKQFTDTFMDMAQNDFAEERVSAEIERLSEEYQSMTIDTYNRFWGRMVGGKMAGTFYSDSVKELSDFYAKRCDYITKYLGEHIPSSVTAG